MYNRRNDSRIGDEIFAMGMLIAPFVYKLVKKGKNKMDIKVQKYQQLSESEKEAVKLKFCRRGVVVLTWGIPMIVLMMLYTWITKAFVINHIVTLLCLIGAYLYMKTYCEKHRTLEK